MDESTKPEKSLRLCQGCRDNFYNGNNSLGVKQCWSFETAVVEPRIIVGIWERPPYDRDRAEWCHSCYKPEGSVAVKPSALTEDGFWKS